MAGTLQQTTTGTYTGTGSAQTITLGFKPQYVRIIDTTESETFEWCAGMADGTGLKTTSAGTAAVASQGLTPTARGFTLGTDDSVAENGDTFVFVAYQ